MNTPTLPRPCFLPFDPGKLSAGFPAPTGDHDERQLDINTYLVRNPAATFFFQVEGRSMEGAEIFDGDILVVDRSLTPRHGQIVVAFINGERLVKRLHCRDNQVVLLAENRDFPPFPLHEGLELVIWDMMTGKFKRFV